MSALLHVDGGGRSDDSGDSGDGGGGDEVLVSPMTFLSQ